MRSRVRRWAMVPLLMGMTMALQSCGATEEVRFAESVAAMERVARTAAPGDGMTEHPQEIGSLEFEDVFRDGDRVYFKVGDSSGLDPYGYVWSPNAKPTDDDPDDATDSSFEHIEGNWYRWQDNY